MKAVEIKWYKRQDTCEGID